MESYSVEAILSAVDDGFSNSMKSAQRSMGGLDEGAQDTGLSIGKIGVGAAVFKMVSMAVDMVKNSIGDAVNRMDTLNNSTRAFENMGFTADETKKAMKGLEAGIDGLPTPLDEAVQGVQLLAASTGDLGKSQEVYNAINDAVLGFGGSAADAQNAVLQLSQGFSKGKIQGEEWNSMLNSQMGPALNAMAEKMGMTTNEMREGLSDGSISIDKFQDALIDLDKNGGGKLKSLHTIAKDSTKGIGTSFKNMKTAIVKGTAELITGFDNFVTDLTGSGIADWIKSFGDTFKASLEILGDSLSKLAPVIKTAFGALKPLAETLKPLAPLLYGVAGAITAVAVASVASVAIKGLTKAFSLMLGAITGANPFVLIIGAVAGLVIGIIHLWNTSDEFRAFWTGVWQTIQEVASSAVEAVKDAWGGIKDWFVSKWNGLTEFFSSLWESIKETFTNASTAIQEAPGKAVDAIKEKWTGIKEFFSSMWTGIQETTQTIWNGILQFFTPIVEGILSPFQPLIEFFTGLWSSIQEITSSMWEIIKSVIMGPVLFIIDLITGDFGQLKEDMAMIWTTISDNALAIWNTLKDLLLSYITAIVETAKNLWNNFKNNILNVWNAVSEQAQTIWNNLKSWLTTTFTNIVQGAKDKWNSLKTNTINIFKNTVQGAKDRWNDFKAWLPNMIASVVANVKQKWQDLKAGTIAIFQGLVASAKGKWNQLVQSVQNVVSTVKGWFNSLANINLGAIGQAIMDSLLGGLKAAWGKVKSFVGGIGDWIREHKGPIRKDRKLLIPAGQAIMDSLNVGLQSSFGDVKNTVTGLTDYLANGVNAMPSLDIASNLENANQKIDTNINHTLNTGGEKKPAIFNVNLGKQKFKAFVEDISEVMNTDAELNMNF